jgi:hypothetical protein
MSNTFRRFDHREKMFQKLKRRRVDASRLDRAARAVNREIDALSPMNAVGLKRR